MAACVNCCSCRTGKNGRIHNGKRLHCRESDRQFVQHRQNKAIDRLLLERISLAGIARAAMVSEQWLQTYGNQEYAGVQRIVQVRAKKRGS